MMNNKEYPLWFPGLAVNSFVANVRELRNGVMVEYAMVVEGVREHA